ncbi:glycosyltransferase family 2 protein [Nocardioides jishulii]|uniref:Glycosyltransferase family 2 protein n=1 Tax=Nocardioides jishulii TaxID=2575440 RepID=A0A4V5TM37_9ACTN|nr:glycosyltransferase family 2 protein [Nocardioides jishulii]TKI61873.1 glycosyltransferase family 2 protein [Nocardioides jishulii]
MMVRDEVDVVAAMVEHHLDQGVDLIVVTDNASVDGTTEVLAAYEALGRVELHHDPEHRKQQHQVVTRMARRARTEHRADWVLNLDADEFVFARDPALTVRQALEATPLHLNAFTVDVVNMIGPTAESGAGFDRLVWRDHRPEDLLLERELHGHPTPNAVHRGECDIVVQQGNHFTSMPSNGQPDPSVALEVLHLPWRSWEQFERKVVNAGRGYEASPHLRPSPKHHGMRDYRLWKEGRLHATYDARCPSPAEFDDWAARGWVEHDTRLLDRLTDLRSRALRPDLLEASLG